MTRSSYAMPAFDGTAALEQRATGLVLIEGGRGRRVEGTPEPVTPRLTVWQSVAFAALGVILVTALAMTSLLVDTLAAQRGSQALSDLQESEMVVQDGDSLWSIAESLELSDASVPDVVSWIKARNGLDGSMLVAGQMLVVPMAGPLD